MARAYIAAKASITVFDFDTKTGALTPVGSPEETDGAGSFLAPSKDGKYLYSLAKPGAASFSIDAASGQLSHINSVKCDISGNAHLVLTSNDRIALAAAYGGGGVNVIRVNEDGSLADVEVGASVKHEGGSNVYQPAQGNEQEQAHPHSCFPDPSGKWALVSDLGQDKVYVYAVETAKARIREHATVPTAPGAGPRHLCFHPKGRWVYGINELDCTVNVYAWSGSSGTLGPAQQTISTLPEGYNNRDPSNAKNAEGKPASGPNRPAQTNATADIHMTPDGRFLYGSNRGHDSIVCFSVGRDGKLELVAFTPTKGEHPRNFSIHPSGRWLLVANQDGDSSNVVVFSLDKRSGKLEAAGVEVSLKTARCIQWAIPQRKLRKPKWITVASLLPDSAGVNVFVKVLKALPSEGLPVGLAEFVVADSTGRVTLSARGEEQAGLCQSGALLRIQNANVRMVKGFVRLEVTKWGVLKPAPDHEDIEPHAGNDVSAVEYELA